MTNTTEQVTQELLCPFRPCNETDTYEMSGSTLTRAIGFDPCVRERCAMCRYVDAPFGGEMRKMMYCGLAGKP